MFLVAFHSKTNTNLSLSAVSQLASLLPQCKLLSEVGVVRYGFPVIFFFGSIKFNVTQQLFFFFTSSLKVFFNVAQVC